MEKEREKEKQLYNMKEIEVYKKENEHLVSLRDDAEVRKILTTVLNSITACYIFLNINIGSKTYRNVLDLISGVRSMDIDEDLASLLDNIHRHLRDVRNRIHSGGWWKDRESRTAKDSISRAILRYTQIKKHVLTLARLVRTDSLDFKFITDLRSIISMAALCLTEMQGAGLNDGKVIFFERDDDYTEKDRTWLWKFMAMPPNAIRRGYLTDVDQTHKGHNSFVVLKKEKENLLEHLLDLHETKDNARLCLAMRASILILYRALEGAYAIPIDILDQPRFTHIEEG